MTPRFVAVASGCALDELSDDQVRQLVAALDECAVVLFRHQALSQEGLVAFAKRLGPLDEGLQTKLLNRIQTRLKYDTISDISNMTSTGEVADKSHKQSLLNVGNQFWHSDSAYAHVPFRYSILHGVQAVSWGGQTQFADLRDAYDALDQRTKDLLEGRIATFYSHHTRKSLGIEDTPADYAAYPPAQWPVIRTHPGSGRKLLWIDSKVIAISGMSVPEGRALAHELLEHIGQRERVYSHEWRPGDVLIYDNRACLHRGRRFDLTERREMRRVSTLETDEFSLGEIALGDVAYA